MAPLPARVLVDLPNWLGDFVHALPALAALKAANQGAETTALLPASHAPLARLLGVTTIARPPGAAFGWARRRLDGSFDVALTARHSSRAKLLLAGSGAGTSLASRGRGAAALGLATFPVDRSRHQRHDLDGALARLGVPGVAPGPFRLPLPGIQAARTVLPRAPLAQSRGTVAFLPATRGRDDKRCPVEVLVEVARDLAGGGFAPVVVVGPGEEWMAWPLVAGAGGLAVSTAWPLDEVAALLAGCDAAVGNDSGLTHLAAAVGCPTVALFGPTDPRRTAPVGGAWIVQPAAAAAGASRSLGDLTAAEVTAAVRAAVAARAATAHEPAAEMPSGVALEAMRRYDVVQRVGR